MFGEAGQYVLDQLKLDFDVYNKHEDSQNPGVQVLIQRSVFMLAAVMQLVLMCQKHRWKLTADLRAWLQEANKKNIVSLINEDGFNRQKNKISKQRSRKGREQRAFGGKASCQSLPPSHG